MTNPIPIFTALRQEILRIYSAIPGVVQVFDSPRSIMDVANFPIIMFSVNGKAQWNRNRTGTNQYEFNKDIDTELWVRATADTLTDAANESIESLVWGALNADLLVGTIRNNMFSLTSGKGNAQLLHIWPIEESGFSIWPGKTGLAWCSLKFSAQIRHNEYSI